MPAGRPPWPYDPELGELICEKIATSEEGLEQVLDEISLIQCNKTPSMMTVYRWLEASEEFREIYARARELQAQVLHDRAQVQAKTPLIGKITERTLDAQGNVAESREKTVDNVDRSKLMVYTTLKRAGQLSPKKYGEKIQQEHTGEAGGPIQIVSTIPRPKRD